jgi:uncharacterized protein YecT (DUF1311 family)
MKTFVRYLLVMFPFGMAHWVCAQQAEKHPIDMHYEGCLSIDSNQTTYGMMHCAQLAEEEWDAELNKSYKQLMEALSPENQVKLRDAQRKWLAFRDSERTFSGDMHYDMQGTMYHVMAADREAEIVKERALNLERYLDTLSPEGQ